MGAKPSGMTTSEDLPKELLSMLILKSIIELRVNQMMWPVRAAGRQVTVT